MLGCLVWLGYSGKAQVYDNARVSGMAWVYGTAQVTTTKRKKKHVE